MIESQFPKGWDEERVSRLIAELDARTDEEWIAADEAAADLRRRLATKKGIAMTDNFMNSTTDQVFDAALSLPDGDRLELVEGLMASLQPEDHPPFDESWREVIRRRSNDIRLGLVNDGKTGGSK